VAICARRKDVLERAAEGIRRATGAEVLWRPADVTRADEVEAFVAAVVAQFGGVDILVNNAGTSAAAAFEAVDDRTWQADIDLKLMAAIRFCRLVIPHMKRRGGGRIINVTTVGGKAPAARSLPTSVTRAAGINLTKSLAHEYAPDRILVNTVKRVPIGRVGEAEEFADLVAFLASERAGFITGAAINFDGGMSTVV
jgi:NAD(P)-dependent dehydrogenase (short-subunit alcohol dehydrogenase family)